MTHIAFLRALNVGGKGVVKMAAVKAAFEDTGCRDVRTFIASGNVLFTSGSKSLPAQQKKILAAMQTLMKAKTEICFRTLADLDGLIADDPFGDWVSDESVKLYVAFLDREPPVTPTLPLADPKECVEIIGLRGRDMLIVSRCKPNGIYGFPTFMIEKMGVVCTARNWNTVVKLSAFART